MLGTSLGNYRVVEQLGEGGMGVVYIGRHEALNRRVAVKVLRPEMSGHADMVQRFFNEAQAATAIRNPGIVQVFDFGTAPDGSAFIVMELLQGETLTARLQQRRLDIVECCRIGRQIANVLQAAHAAGITHRDLKPDNLFLVPDAEVAGGERVKVLDFGIAKLAGELYAAGVKTRTGVMMGTPSYMSPEQCRSAVTAEPRSDIYSLGCILFEMMCGRPPFVGGGLGDILGAHLHAPPPDPRSLAPDVPPALADLIVHLLAKKPDARPQTMAAISQQLGEILRMLGDPSPRAPTPLPVPDLTLLDPSDGKLPLESTRPSEPKLPPDPAQPSVRAPTPSPAPAPTPTPASAHTSAAFLRTSSLPPHERPTTPVSVPSLPVIARAPMPSPGPQRDPNNDSAGRRDLLQRARMPRRLFVLGGLGATAIVVTAATIALAPEGPAPQERLTFANEAVVTSTYVDAAIAADVAIIEDAATFSTVAQPPPPTVVDVAQKTVLPMRADDLKLECQGYQTARKWDELAQCADTLLPIEPKRAAELKTLAMEEIKVAPRLAAIEAALRDKDLKRAKVELDQVWPGSADYTSIRRKYDLAETQVIIDLAVKLERVKDSDCTEYNALLATERPLKPTRVTAEAARRIPCSPPVCIGEAYAEKGQEQYASGQLPAALAAYEAAYACRAVPQWAEKAFIISCNLANLAKAKSYWQRLPLAMKSRGLGICERYRITHKMLIGP